MKITIMGAAGTLGSCAAFTIAIHKLANEIVLIDPGADMLKAHWMDLNTVAAAQDVLVNRGNFPDMAGSDIVVITSGAPSGVTSSRADLITGNLPIIIENAENIMKYCPKAIVITETNPVDPLNYAVYLVNGKENRQKYIGYTLNDTIRFRMWTAAALGVRASRVRGLVMGEHGHTQVMLWSSLKVDGRPVQVDEESKKKIQSLPPQTLHDYETLKPKRTAGWTSAVGRRSVMFWNWTRTATPSPPAGRPCWTATATSSTPPRTTCWRWWAWTTASSFTPPTPRWCATSPTRNG